MKIHPGDAVKDARFFARVNVCLWWGLYVAKSETIFLEASSTLIFPQHHIFPPSSSYSTLLLVQKGRIRSFYVTAIHLFFLLAPNALPLCGSNIKHNNLRIRWGVMYIYAETSSSSFHAKCFNIFNQFLWLLFFRRSSLKICYEKLWFCCFRFD